MGGGVLGLESFLFWNANDSISDTVPIRSYQSSGRYQPKYESPVLKFQGMVNHIGLICFVSGPHLGSMSDTTLARLHRPPFNCKECVLADLAYESVPNMLTPFKNTFGPTGIPKREAEYNRLHQFYRARSEHTFAKLKKHAIIAGTWRSDDCAPLEQAFKVLCSCINIYHCVYLPYPPYIAHWDFYGISLGVHSSFFLEKNFKKN